LRPQLRDRREATRPPRKRYRCPECFNETLIDPDGSFDVFTEDGWRKHREMDCYPCLMRRGEAVTMEPVARRKQTRT
jgi:hypothetical protein